jgi:hypothetical protein
MIAVNPGDGIAADALKIAALAVEVIVAQGAARVRKVSAVLAVHVPEVRAVLRVNGAGEIAARGVAAHREVRIAKAASLANR